MSPELELDLDLRMRMVWNAADGNGIAIDAAGARVLRFAYVAGYTAALTEPVRGQLCVDHDMPVPVRPDKA